jgi:molybdate transport system permease protein
MMNWTNGELNALLLSLRVSGLAVLCLLPIAVSIAWLLSRSRFSGKIFLEALIALPLVLPPVVTGYLLLIGFGKHGYFGRFLNDYFGIQLSFNWWGAALASAVLAFPLAVRAIRQSFESIDPRLDLVAQTLGASKSRRFFTIHLPLAAPGLITGALLAFARSLGEFGATITFVGNIPKETRTIPLAIYTAIQQPDGEAQSLRLVLLSVVLAVLAVLASEWLSRRHKRDRE